MYGMHSEFSSYVSDCRVEVLGRFIGRNKSLYDQRVFISFRWFILKTYGLTNKCMTVISVNLVFAYYLHLSY